MDHQFDESYPFVFIGHVSMSEHRTRYNLNDFLIILDGNFEIPDCGVFRISKALM